MYYFVALVSTHKACFDAMKVVLETEKSAVILVIFSIFKWARSFVLYNTSSTTKQFQVEKENVSLVE
jgi:hypothetical protein